MDQPSVDGSGLVCVCVCVAECLKLHSGLILEFHQQTSLFQLAAMKINLLEALKKNKNKLLHNCCTDTERNLVL